MKRAILFVLGLALRCDLTADAKVIHGDLWTGDNWHFLARFCFLSLHGKFDKFRLGVFNFFGLFVFLAFFEPKIFFWRWIKSGTARMIELVPTIRLFYNFHRSQSDQMLDFPMKICPKSSLLWLLFYLRNLMLSKSHQINGLRCS